MHSSHQKQLLRQVLHPCAALVVGLPGSPAGTVGDNLAEVGTRAVGDTPVVQDSLGVDNPEQCSQGEAADNTQQVHLQCGNTHRQLVCKMVACQVLANWMVVPQNRLQGSCMMESIYRQCLGELVRRLKNAMVESHDVSARGTGAVPQHTVKCLATHPPAVDTGPAGCSIRPVEDTGCT